MRHSLEGSVSLKNFCSYKFANTFFSEQNSKKRIWSEGLNAHKHRHLMIGPLELQSGQKSEKSTILKNVLKKVVNAKKLFLIWKRCIWFEAIVQQLFFTFAISLFFYF